MKLVKTLHKTINFMLKLLIIVATIYWAGFMGMIIWGVVR